MVSVIIPVYNVLPYLKESLDSVTNQTYKNLEIIIVDGGSTDGSASVCDSYKTDSRVKVIHQENKGLSGARNAGLELATGEYIAFLDSDDAFLLNMIQTMVEGIERSKADIAVCGFDIVYSKKNMTESRFFKKRGFRIEKEETLSRNRVNDNNFMFSSKETLQKHKSVFINDVYNAIFKSSPPNSSRNQCCTSWT